MTVSRYIRDQHKSMFDDKYRLFQSIPDLILILATLYYNPTGVHLGDHVQLIPGQVRTGIVAFIGTTNFSEGAIIGIKLCRWSPNSNNGCINGKKIFEAGSESVQFVYPKCIAKIIKPGFFTEGAYAKIKGLLKVPKFNGKTVQLMRYVEKKSRWSARMIQSNQGKKMVGLREENLEPTLPVFESNTCCAQELLLANKPNIGDRVKMMDGRYGIVKYVGTVDFSSFATWIGLELEEWDPNGHNGTVEGKTYFTVNDGFGYLLKLRGIIRMQDYSN